MSTPTTASETATRILDVAERLVQTRGFNAFSYADVASALKLTKATLHYHFPTKAKLGERLIERYRSGFMAALDSIGRANPDAPARLRAYVGIYADVLADKRMCLCGMLAADFPTLPKPMRDGVRAFFEDNEAWLVDVLENGSTARELRFDGPAVEAARLLVAALEGAMLLARSYADPKRFGAAAERLLGDLGIGRPPALGTVAGPRRASR